MGVSIAYTCGWRMQSEVLALERRHVDFDAGTLRLDPGTTKNGEGRMVYLTPEVRRLLAEQLGRVDELQRELKRIIPYVFPHFAGRRSAGAPADAPSGKPGRPRAQRPASRGCTATT